MTSGGQTLGIPYCQGEGVELADVPPIPIG